MQSGDSFVHRLGQYSHLQSKIGLKHNRRPSQRRDQYSRLRRLRWTAELRGACGLRCRCLDNLFKMHDEKLIPFASDGIQDNERPLLISPHVELIASIANLDAGSGLEDPEAILYAGLTSLALTAELATIPGGLEALGSKLDIPTMLTQAVENMKEGLAEVPGEGKSLNGALHWFEKHFVEDLVELLTPPVSSDIWA